MNYKEVLAKDTVKTIRRQLKVEKYAQSIMLSSEALQVDAIYDHVLDAVQIRFSRKILCEDLPVSVVSVPINWWEHFKQDKMPNWFIKKYPIKYRIIERSFRVMYPHYKLNNDILGRGYLELMETDYESNYI